MAKKTKDQKSCTICGADCDTNGSNPPAQPGDRAPLCDACFDARHQPAHSPTEVVSAVIQAAVRISKVKK